MLIKKESTASMKVKNEWARYLRSKKNTMHKTMQ